MANLRIYEHIKYESYDFMQQKCENNKSKVRSAESSFGQKVWSTFLIAQRQISFTFHCCLLLNEIKVSLKNVMDYFSTKSLSKYLTATFPTCIF
jgi:hypothetical protein